MQSAIMQSAILLSVVMLSVIMLDAVMLSVIMLDAVMLSVMEPHDQPLPAIPADIFMNAARERIHKTSYDHLTIIFKLELIYLQN
jgi:hypothetical protein